MPLLSIFGVMFFFGTELTLSEKYSHAVPQLIRGMENVEVVGAYERSSVSVDGNSVIEYCGPVRLCKLGATEEFGLKTVTAETTKLSWARLVESYSPKWAYKLSADKPDSDWQWNGVTFLTSKNSSELEMVNFRRRRMCHRFICGKFFVYCRTVEELINDPTFEVVAQSVDDATSHFTVDFKGPALSQVVDEVTVRGRLTFDTTNNWRLVGYDVVTQLDSTDIHQYYAGAIELKNYGTSQDPRFLPARVVAEEGTVNASSQLGEPIWLKDRIRTTVEISDATFGELTQNDFVPSKFGFPDHLVRGESEPETRPFWNSPWAWLIAINAIVFVWWLGIRNRGKAAV